MPRSQTTKPTASTFSIEEIPGTDLTDLITAQEAARAALAADLADTIRELLEAGVLVQVDGQIIPNPDR